MGGGLGGGIQRFNKNHPADKCKFVNVCSSPFVAESFLNIHFFFTKFEMCHKRLLTQNRTETEQKWAAVCG